MTRETIGLATYTRSTAAPRGRDFGYTQAERDRLKGLTKAVQPQTVNVEARYNGGTYDLTVTVDGEAYERNEVAPGDLGQTIGAILNGVIEVLTKTAATKPYHRSDSAPMGMGTPVSNRSRLRFG